MDHSMAKVWCPLSTKPDKIEWGNYATKESKNRPPRYRCCRCGNTHDPVVNIPRLG
jgi:hypothetical protein